MIHYAIGYVATAILFGLLDALWLRTMVPAVYRPEIGTLLMDGWRPAPALIFYALYMLGIQIFAVAPAIEAGRWQVAAQWGALFGFFCYMTYDLTNHATMKIWSTKVTLLDIAWGAAPFCNRDKVFCNCCAVRAPSCCNAQ